MRKILLPWGGEMGIISLRCRVSAASGGASPAAGGGVLVTPCRCRAILFSVAIVPLVYEPCNPHRAIARGGKKFQFAWNRQECPTWTFLFFCAIRRPADDGLPYRELFFLHTNPCPLFRRICGRAGDTPPFPVRCAFSRWNSVHADLGFPPRGRNLPAAAGFYGVWALGLTPRRAGGRCLPRPRWSVLSDRGGPSCPSGGSAPPAEPSPCRGGAGR